MQSLPSLVGLGYKCYDFAQRKLPEFLGVFLVIFKTYLYNNIV